MKKKENITIIIPKGATTDVENGLGYLTEFLTNEVFNGEWQGGGLLGGEYGYGVDYENNVFMMHPFCWCYEEDCKWCYGGEPNFIYKPTNTRIWWYKWIGRGQEQKGKLPKDWLEKCVKSVAKLKDNK